MPKKNGYGLLIDYEYCTGCYACQVACAQEYQWPEGWCSGHHARSYQNLADPLGRLIKCRG